MNATHPMSRRIRAALLAIAIAASGQASAAERPTAQARALIDHLPLVESDGGSIQYAQLNYVDTALLSARGTGLYEIAGHARVPELPIEEAESGSGSGSEGHAPPRFQRLATLISPSFSPSPPAVIQLQETDEAALHRTWSKAGYSRIEALWHGPDDEALQFRAPYLLVAPDADVLATMDAAPGGTGAASRGDIRNILDAIDRKLGQHDRLAQFYLQVRDPRMDSGRFRAEYDSEDRLPHFSAMMIGEIQTAENVLQALVAIPWSDCAVARRAKAFVSRTWRELATPAAGSRLVSFKAKTEWSLLRLEGGCVLFGHVSDDADLPRSPYLELVLRYERWGLPPLRTGFLPYLPHLPDPDEDPAP